MAEPLYQLVYCSLNTISGASVNVTDEIRNILPVSRRNNVKVGVTGALLFTTSGFAQVLEGQMDAVEATFERIQSDMRHSDVTVLSFLPVERRSFPDWSMAFAGQPATGVAYALKDMFPPSSDVEALTLAGGKVLRLLESAVRDEDEPMPREAS
jgi:blue light- and temperature-responsive anti-repressor